MRAFVFFVIASLVVASVQVAAGDESVRIERGTTVAIRTGELTGSGTNSYSLTASGGQVLSVHFVTASDDCYMNVWAPGADEVTHQGAVAGNDFVASLARPGVYRVQAFLKQRAEMREEECRYELSFHLTRAGAAVPLPTVPQGRDALRGAVEKCLEMVGVPAYVVKTTRRTSGLWELVLQERGSSRKSACTVRDDGTLEDWAER